MPKRRNNHYSKELKLQAVQDYLTGGGSYEALRKKYGLLSSTQLKGWVKCYNGHNESKEKQGATKEIDMTKGRKTTQLERAEIVAFCLEHGKDYPLTIQTYDVSYQQIYSWVRKYEEKGIDGLIDGRGRTKPESEMDEIEKLRAQNKILQAQIRDKEMEIALLKKLNELEGWDA